MLLSTWRDAFDLKRMTMMTNRRLHLRLSSIFLLLAHALFACLQIDWAAVTVRLLGLKWGIPFIASSKCTTSKLFVFLHHFLERSIKHGRCKYCFKVFDITEKRIEPMSTDCEADALTTTAGAANPQLFGSWITALLTHPLCSVIERSDV